MLCVWESQSPLWHHQNCDFPLISSLQSKQIIGKKAIWRRVEACTRVMGFSTERALLNSGACFLIHADGTANFPSNISLSFCLPPPLIISSRPKTPHVLMRFGAKLRTKRLVLPLAAYSSALLFFAGKPRDYKVDGVSRFSFFSRHSLDGDKSSSTEKEKHNGRPVFSSTLSAKIACNFEVMRPKSMGWLFLKWQQTPFWAAKWKKEAALRVVLSLQGCKALWLLMSSIKMQIPLLPAAECDCLSFGAHARYPGPASSGPKGDGQAGR